jgi:hypothetical protein
MELSSVDMGTAGWSKLVFSWGGDRGKELRSECQCVCSRGGVGNVSALKGTGLRESWGRREVFKVNLTIMRFKMD